MTHRRNRVAKVASLAIGLSVVVGAAAHADTWTARLVKTEKSSVSCDTGGRLKLDASGDELKVYSGKSFETRQVRANIAADGSVSQEYTGLGASRLRLTSNARTRKLLITDITGGTCSWDLVPE